MTFQPSETVKTVQIPITNDAILENTEVFTAVLQAMDASVVEIVSGNATISIMDDDGTYTYLLQYMGVSTWILYNVGEIFFVLKFCRSSMHFYCVGISRVYISWKCSSVHTLVLHSSISGFNIRGTRSTMNIAYTHPCKNILLCAQGKIFISDCYHIKVYLLCHP